MIDDVYEPLARYRDEFRGKFSALAREKFKELTERSGVDVRANRALVGEIKKLQAAADSAGSKKRWCGALMAIAILGAIAALAANFFVDAMPPAARKLLMPGALALLGFALALLPLFRAASRRLDSLRASLAVKMSAAWEQMEPLNRLYSWDIPVRLIEATVPRLKFDPYFTAGRLAALRARFGWNDSFNDGKSVIFAQSGEINSNPFVFGHYLDMEWGVKRYEGSKNISWTDWETGADGKRRRVTRHETLYAHVTKPLPVYSEKKLLVYGNDAAPNLSFSREPSGLSGKEGSLFGAIRKKWRLSRLKAYSRVLTDDSDFTLMGNHEFETWFHAKNRDNEVEFRLLFTPVAQTQMLALMKDTKVGYGDDFTFVKSKKVNMLFSSHLDAATIDTDPARFRYWDYDAAFAFFIRFNERYFKDAYFALAPLLAIPLYQQTRTHEDVWKDVLARKEPSFWEHEALAYYFGEKIFKHPACVTRSLLKTKVVEREGDESTIAVTARGYRGVDRVAFEEVHGGDGRWHTVEVPWVEYLPVERTSTLCLSERETPSVRFSQMAATAGKSACRRSIRSCIPTDANP